jgi:transposase-like protein
MLCPHCSSDDIVKNGRSASDRQRYWCPACRVTFQLEPPKARTKAVLTVEAMRSLREQGWSFAKIGIKAHISRERVRQLISRQQ